MARTSTQARKAPRQWLGDAQTRQSLPLYVASLIVTLSGIIAVSLTIVETEWTQRFIGLVIAGHVAGYLMRGWRVPLVATYLPAAGLLFLSMVSELGLSRAELGLAPSSHLPPDQSLQLFISWIAVIRSFTLSTNAALLFSCVPTLALLGLAGSSNPNPEIPILFGTFIFATIFMTVYEQHLRRVSLTGREPWALSWHLSTATAVFFLCLTLGTILGIGGGRALGSLSPYAVPALSRLQPMAGNFMAATQISSGAIAVGAGPIALLPTPMFDIYAPEPGLWRTAVLEEFDGHVWSPLRGRSEQLPPPDAAVAPEAVPPGVNMAAQLYPFRIDPTPFQSEAVPKQTVRQILVARGQMAPYLPVLADPVEVRYPEPRLYQQRGNGVVRGGSYIDPGFSFQVISDVSTFDPGELRRVPPSSLARNQVHYQCFAVPATAERLRPLAAEITRGAASDYDRVLAIIEYIERMCTYSLNGDPTPPGEDAVEYYLFETRVGACDLAATATVMLCRATGIAARAVTGYFVAYRPPGKNCFEARQMDSHMWLEVFFPGFGWVQFNPAPPARDLEPTPLQNAMYRLQRMFGLLVNGRLENYLVFGIALILLVVLGRPAAAWMRCRLVAWRRERFLLATGGPLALGILYGRMGRVLGRAGWAREPSLTPDEYRSWLATEWGGNSAPAACVSRITDWFVRACYAGEFAPAAVEQARTDLDRLRRCIPRRHSSEARAAGGGEVARSGPARS